MPETSRTLGDLETMLFLRRVPLFEGLEPEDLQRIAMTAVERVYPPDEALVREGDLGDELVVIVEGSVRVVHVEPDGTERLHPALRGGRSHRRARGPARGAAGGDGHRRGRRGARAGDRWRRAQGDPARAPDAAMAMLATLAERLSTHSSVDAMTDGSPTRRPLPTGTVTFLRTDVEGSMAAGPRARVGAGTR